MTDDGDRITLTPGFDLQNAEAVLGIVKCYPFDQTRQDLVRTRRRCPRHLSMMAIKMPGRYAEKRWVLQPGCSMVGRVTLLG